MSLCRTLSPVVLEFVIVLVGLMLCEGRRMLAGLVRQVAEATSLAGLSHDLAQAPWDEREIAKHWLEDFRKMMEPAVKAEQARLRQVQPKRRGRPRVPLVTGYVTLDDSTMHKPKGKKMQGLGKHHSTTCAHIFMARPPGSVTWYAHNTAHGWNVAILRVNHRV